MSDSDFTNLVPAENKKGGESAPTDSSSQLTQELRTSGTQIIERTIHTLHTIHIYPNGQVYIKRSQSWLDKKGMVVKKKEKKAPVKIKESNLGEEERY